MTTDEYWMGEALKLAARAAREGEVPVGALIVNENQQCIAACYNQTIQHTDPTAHAEILALREAALISNNYRLPGTTLYSTLEPCMMCAGAIIQARVSRVVFAAYDQKIGAVCSVWSVFQHPQVNHKPDIAKEIFAVESVQLLQNFFQAKRKNKKLEN
jgi:tRNA(adenine34) deaminase